MTQASGDGVADDQFGISVAFSGDTAVVGSCNAGVGANADQGVAYVFKRNGPAWTLQQKLVANDGATGDGFGVSVAIQGDTVIVGAYGVDDGSEPTNADRGAAYVFIRTGVNWTQQEKLTPVDGGGGDLFGFSVSINGDTAVIGAPFNDGLVSHGGAAYVYVRSGSSWAQQLKLLASDSAIDDAFGVAVAVEADTAAIGSLRHDVGSSANQGSAYIFTRNGLSWTQQQELTATDGTSNDQFGVSVALGGNSVIIGANFKDNGTNLAQGAAYIFTSSSGVWMQQQKLLAADGASNDMFGTSVAISLDTAVVGCSDNDVAATDQGSAYTFTRSGTTWSEEQNLTAGDGTGGDFLGSYVAIDGSTVVVGAPLANIDGNADQGAVYVFLASSPTLAVDDVVINEGNAGTTNANFTVSLSPSSWQTVTVQYATVEGTATAGSDYVATAGTLTFAPGQTSQPLSVTVKGDTTFEPNESFLIDLSSATNAIIIDNEGQGTIVNDDPLPPVLEFTQPNFSSNENSQSVTLTVKRMGNPGPAVSVDFKTNSDLTYVECSAVNGQANQRCDYLLTNGTLLFASNEFEKSFTVVTFNDAYVEGDETFGVSLANPTGGDSVLGARSTATVTISDDDASAPAANPIDGSRYFVRQNYYDFLQRVPDQGGEDYWTDQIDNGCAGDSGCITRRRVGVSAAFFVSSEFARSGGYVYRLYKAAFGEQTLYRPAYDQFSADRARVVDGMNLDQGKLDLANLFIQRSDFISRYPPTLTATQFVDAMLQTVQQGSGVTFSPSEKQNFITDVDTGGRGLMLKNLANNAAYTEAVFNRAFVLMQYFGYLRRDPDQGGYDFWLGILNASSQNFEGMVCAFVTSPEYQRRFSPVFTRTNSNCQ